MATKKPTTKKVPAKKPSRQKKAQPQKSSSAYSRIRKHIGLRRDSEDFMTFRVNRETIYWMVLGVVVISFTIWLMQLQRDIQELYDQVDASTAQQLDS